MGLRALEAMSPMSGGGGGGAGVPLDSGVSLLLAAGIGYGAKKYADSRKAAKVNN